MENKQEKEEFGKEEKGTKGKNKKGQKKLSLKSKIGIFGGFLVLLFAVAFVALYLFSPLEKIARPIFKKVPFPVAIVDKGRAIITSAELIQNTDAVKKFYESQDYAKSNQRVDFSTEAGKNRLKIKEKDVFNKLIENKIIEKVANEKGINISAQEAQVEIERLIAEGGDKKSLELNLMSLYGWTIDDFRDQVVIYQMYTKQLFDWYALNIESTPGYEKIGQAKRKLNDDGSNFSEVAKEYSEGDSAENGGEIGWFTHDKLVEGVAEPAFEMQEGEISDILISEIGFHVIQVVGFDGEGSEVSPRRVNLRQIFVRGESYLDWLSKQKNTVDIRVLMRDYSWDKESGFVVFRDEELTKMEKKIKLRAEGDPSL